MAIRIFTILVFVALGLPRFAGGFADSQVHCGETTCHTLIVEASCCPTQNVEVFPDSACGSGGYCSMSGGTCRCGVSPNPDPERRPDAPMNSSDRDLVISLLNGRARITDEIDPGDAMPKTAPLVHGLHEGRTHNEVQAFLSVWQT